MPHAEVKKTRSLKLRKRSSPELNNQWASPGSDRANTTKSFAAMPKRRSSSRPLTRPGRLLSSGCRPAAGCGNLNASRAAKIKRWDGNRRTTTVWDSLRRDDELWFPRGDCLIHFYELGQSKRGASLRISLTDIIASNFWPFLDRYPPYPVIESPSAASSSSSEGDYFSNSSKDVKYEIYVPAPADLGRDEAFRYHLTTRNVFAWMFGIPIVGNQLGEALISLLDRMNCYRFDMQKNRNDVLLYLDNQGYTDFRDCPDHSLAVLQFAEKFQHRELWTDAFVHCVGMNDELVSSAEFEFTSHTSKALIMRAYLEMDLRLERAGNSLATFLEDDLSGTYLGLGDDAQAHLERFRSFLHSFYVGKYGYWPPEPTTRNGTALPKPVCLSMYFDFRRLYEYLVDSASTCSIQNNRPAKGGICVLQNVAAFDARNKYHSLPHPLPLIPEIPDDMLRQRSGSLMKMFGNRQARAERRATVLAALSAATNPSNTAVTECALLREYLLFEKSWTMKESETVSCADARKVRWILIYTILQTLISVTRAPIEVRDIEGVSYPLCCQVVGTPPWKTNTSAGKDVQVPAKTPRRIIEIKPDVQYNTPRSSRTSFSSITLSAFPMIRRGSTGQDSVIKTPTSRATTSCEIFGPGYSETMKGFYGDLGPSSPGSSAADASSGVAWSCSSSEDGMEHVSVGESVSSYGEGEEKRNSNSSTAESGRGWSIASFQSEISSSAEEEHYIWA